MNSKYRIKNKLEFDNMIKTSLKIKNSFFIVFYKEMKLNHSRFGIAVGKKTGNAVERNRLKRIIREILRNNLKTFKKDLDYIIIVNKECKKSNYKEMESNLLKLIN